MNCEHLDPEEFMVECELRNLHGSLFTLVKQLSTVLESEIKDGDEPQRPHEKARKQPRREIALCENKLRELQIQLQENLSADPINTNSLECIQSRLLHIFSRLSRISTSSIVHDNAQKLVLSCNSFLAAINSVLEDKVNPNNSLEVIRAVQLEEIPLFDEHDVGENSEENPEQAPSGSLDKSISVPSHPSRIPLSSTSQNGPRESDVNINEAVAEISILLENLTRRVSLIDSSNLDSQSSSKAPAQQNTFSIETNTSQPTSTSSPNFSNSSRKYPTHLQVRKWNINFNPNAKDAIPIEQFLYRVQHLAKVYSIRDEDLVNDVQFLLSGEACEYYWLYIKTTPNTNWINLKEALMNRFQDRKTDFDIKCELHKRKQNAPRETFLEFYSAILSISYTLKAPLSDKDLIDLMMMNMRDGLQISLAGESFHDIQSLVKRCVVLEDSWNRIAYVPESVLQRRRNVSELGSQTSNACMSVTVADQASNYNSFDVSVSALNNSYQNFNKNSSSVQNNRTCWNCDVVGLHHWMDCPDSVKRKFCYGCGTKNVLKPNCIKCFPNQGNRSREVKSSGNHFHNNEILPTLQSTTEEAASNTDPELQRRQV